ncbi:MAG: efflux RND transporter permease subunit [Gammaproteobacteria bacterium]
MQTSRGDKLFSYYTALVLHRPNLTLALLATTLFVLALGARNFHLDVSAESLVLENDADLVYYRSITSRYGSDDYLIATYTPQSDLFSEDSLGKLKALRDELAALERVASVASLLDVPLLKSPPIAFAELSRGVRTLESADVDKKLAQQELTTSEFYRNRLVSPDGQTTAIQINFERDETFWRLLNKRNQLRERALDGAFTDAESRALEQATLEFENYHQLTLERQEQTIHQVRLILDKYRTDAELFLGGVPMIATDMMSFIRHDIVLFGSGVLIILGIALGLAFRNARWIFLPFLVAIASSISCVGFLGFIGWPVTVVSSNFLSLVLIFSLSLSVHLIVRYQELQRLDPESTQYDLVAATVKSKFAPCLYTVITTMVAFGSLVLSDIRPVIDFGWMMVVALAAAFLFAFTLFPAMLVKLAIAPLKSAETFTQRFTGWFAQFADHYTKPVIAVTCLIVVVCVLGMRLLSVENRFIDYFHESTEIFQGMKLIDQKLGGTTPLDVIIDAPDDFQSVAESTDALDSEFDDGLGDLFDDVENKSITASSYWFNVRKIDDIGIIHEYLDQLPDTGKVLSLHTAMGALNELDEDDILDNFFLSLLYTRLPSNVRAQIVDPYFSKDNDQIRFSIRVRESDLSLNRQQLVEQIYADLKMLPATEGTNVRLTGMLILYNNLLQSLFRSQILTLGTVFLAIVITFAVVFRSVKVAAIAIVPNLMAAGLVLGLMGWLGISLDIMTITIAAISVGIAVDDTIHYIHRYREEFEACGDYRLAIYRSHSTIGRAMYYTTFTITIGFVILALSNFVPTVYFGLLTGFAMVSALLCDLVVLPVLLATAKPYGTGSPIGAEPTGG